VARHPLVHWLAVAAAAAITASFILDRTAAADGARQRWGTDRTVVVATVDLVPGQVVGAGDTRTEAWPLALLPDDALRSLPSGAVVAEPIGAGEPLVRRRIGRAGVGPVAALLPAGSRGVHIPVGDAPPRVVPGDRVDLVAGGLALDGTIVASAALVVAVDERSVVVAVDAAELPAVAGALVNSTVVLAIGGDPPAAP
jgi:Flp pilus assembly protein CpaB